MTAIDISPIVNTVIVYLAPVVGTAVVAGATYIVAQVNALAKRHGMNLDLQIDAQHRQALHDAATNLAGKLIVMGAAKMVPTGQIQVDPEVLLQLANELIRRVPDAAHHFGITQEAAGNLIAEKIGLSATATPPTK